MAIPSPVKFTKDGVEYVSNVDRINYSISELTRAALKDVGRFFRKYFTQSFYSTFKRKNGKVGAAAQYWVRRRETDLQVGIKPTGWYGGFQENGSSTTPKYGLIEGTIKDNIPEIIKIESMYLSALENEAAALAMIDESEGGNDE